MTLLVLLLMVSKNGLDRSRLQLHFTDGVKSEVAVEKNDDVSAQRENHFSTLVLGRQRRCSSVPGKCVGSKGARGRRDTFVCTCWLVNHTLIVVFVKSVSLTHSSRLLQACIPSIPRRSFLATPTEMMTCQRRLNSIKYRHVSAPIKSLLNHWMLSYLAGNLSH